MSEYEDAVEALGNKAVDLLFASFFIPNETRRSPECRLAWESKDGPCMLTSTSIHATLLIENLDHIMLSTNLDYVFGYARIKKERLSDSITAQGQEAEEILGLIRTCETLFMERDQSLTTVR